MERILQRIGGWLWGRRDSAVLLVRHTVGNALVLHVQPGISTDAQSVALSVPPDPENDIVVLDVAGESNVSIWEAAAAALPRSRRGIRLIVCGMAAEQAALVGQWLAQRLRRPVTAPRGYVIRGGGGTLFVHSGPESGWVRHARGREPVWEAKRFPRPEWDAAVIEHRRTSATSVVEPLPGGVWLHDERGDGERVREHWTRLMTRLPCRPDRMAVVLGCPGTPAVTLDDIARFWRGLDEQYRQSVRFVQYGPVQNLHGGRPIGQFLADLLSQPVICYAGLPISASDDSMVTVDLEGELGWPLYATELQFHPGAEKSGRAPEVLTYRVPPELTEEVSPRVYWYADDAVVEVVPSGLWMRADREPDGAEAVRRVAPRADAHSLIFDDSAVYRTDRIRTLAEDLMARLEPAVREVSRLVPMSAVISGVGRREEEDTDEDTDVARAKTVTGSMSELQTQIEVEIANLPTGKPSATDGPRVSLDEPTVWRRLPDDEPTVKHRKPTLPGASGIGRPVADAAEADAGHRTTRAAS